MTNTEEITSKVESNLSEIRSRIDAESDPGSRSRILLDVMEILCVDFVDLLDAAGWTERANEISCIITVPDRYAAVQRVQAAEGPQLAAAATAAGAGERYAVTVGLIGELGKLAPGESRA